MSTVRIALANVRNPASPDEAIDIAASAIAVAALEGAALVAFPECLVPGYRAPGRDVPAPDAAFLERAFDTIADRAARARVAVILGAERLTRTKPVPTALVIDADGRRLGFQDKVQLDPSEEATYAAGSERQLFHAASLSFGIVICHEGWRYPETARWAARRGAQIVFHPQFNAGEPGMHRPVTYGEPQNTFHEKAVLCRAAENTCYFATINYASAGSPTTSAVARPDGTLLAWQPYGVEGLLVADIEPEEATGLLAKRYKPID
jgi:predicted amidohydrolase